MLQNLQQFLRGRTPDSASRIEQEFQFALDDSTDPPGSYLTPSFEHARVADAMRPRVLTCEPGTLLTAVAQQMASEHVHAIVVLLEAIESEREIDRRQIGRAHV